MSKRYRWKRKGKKQKTDYRCKNFGLCPNLLNGRCPKWHPKYEIPCSKGDECGSITGNEYCEYYHNRRAEPPQITGDSTLYQKILDDYHKKYSEYCEEFNWDESNES